MGLEPKVIGDIHHTTCLCVGYTEILDLCEGKPIMENGCVGIRCKPSSCCSCNECGTCGTFHPWLGHSNIFGIRLVSTLDLSINGKPCSCCCYGSTNRWGGNYKFLINDVTSSLLKRIWHVPHTDPCNTELLIEILKPDELRTVPNVDGTSNRGCDLITPSNYECANACGAGDKDLLICLQFNSDHPVVPREWLTSEASYSLLKRLLLKGPFFEFTTEFTHLINYICVLLKFVAP